MAAHSEAGPRQAAVSHNPRLSNLPSALDLHCIYLYDLHLSLAGTSEIQQAAHVMNMYLPGKGLVVENIGRYSLAMERGRLGRLDEKCERWPWNPDFKKSGGKL